jgi:hypothetical protein
MQAKGSTHFVLTWNNKLSGQLTNVPFYMERVYNSWRNVGEGTGFHWIMVRCIFISIDVTVA